MISYFLRKYQPVGDLRWDRPKNESINFIFTLNVISGDVGREYITLFFFFEFFVFIYFFLLTFIDHESMSDGLEHFFDWKSKNLFSFSFFFFFWTKINKKKTVFVVGSFVFSFTHELFEARVLVMVLWVQDTNVIDTDCEKHEIFTHIFSHHFHPQKKTFLFTYCVHSWIKLKLSRSTYRTIYLFRSSSSSFLFIHKKNTTFSQIFFMIFIQWMA